MLIIALIAVGGLGIIFGAFLTIASKKLKVEEDPAVEKVMEALPQTDCGACGYPGCRPQAEKMVSGDDPPNACITGGQEVADNVAAALGVEAHEAVRVVAVMLCNGGEAEAVMTGLYRGEQTCAASDLTGGEKACVYSCLGYGDCVESCNYDSMVMNDNGIPVVFYDACVGCVACVKACPRDLLEMHPVDHKLFVYCKNKDKGPVAKKACKVACIACNLCVKDCEIEGGMEMVDNLAIVNYETCPQDDKPIVRCPTHCILFDKEVENTKEAVRASLMKRAG